jgi:hypothetical protein
LGEFRESKQSAGIAPYGLRQARLEPLALSASGRERMVHGWAATSEDKRIDFLRLLADLHHLVSAKIWVAGGGAGGDAPDALASALGLPYGQPQPPKHPSPS